MASVVAQMPVNNKCVTTEHAISVLIMNGKEDPILPEEGGPVGRRKVDERARGLVQSVADSVIYWLDNNGMSRRATESELRDVNRRDKSSVKIKRYRGDAEKTEPSLTQHYARLYKSIVGNQNKDFEIAKEIWKFFERNK